MTAMRSGYTRSARSKNWLTTKGIFMGADRTARTHLRP